MADSTDPTTVGVPTGTVCHPAYLTEAPIWRKLAHVYEGTGGFRDGTYLVAHPREWKDHSKLVSQEAGKDPVYDVNPNPVIPTAKLTARRKLARYENVAATLLDTKRSAIFRESITRTVGAASKTTPHPLELFWANVDGRRTHITDYISQGFIPSLLFGHVAHLMDRPIGPRPRTKAEEQPPYLRTYSPLDIPDWLVDDMGNLVAMKFLEIVPRKSLKDRAKSNADVRERIVDAAQWEITREAGQAVNRTGQHRFGRLPVVMQYGKRRALTDFLGQSVLGDPMLYIDLYNLTSELRELLRNQTFGWLNVPLGTGDGRVGIEEAMRMLGQAVGTDNVVFSPGSAQFIQPSAENVTVYQQEREQLLRTIYRLAAVPWEADSRDAEAAESMKLKREDMNQVLATYADECEKTEYEIVELWFRAHYGENRWQAEMEAAKVTIRYPDTFDVTPFAELLEQAQAAQTINMGPTFMKELRRRLVQRFIPDATEDILNQINKDLETMAKQEADLSSESGMKRIRATLEKFGADPSTLAA
jgi:hypothetical protein